MEQKDCTTNEPKWIAEAKKHIGLIEGAGDTNNPEIIQMWKDIKRGGIKSDSVPWCASFVGAMLERSGIQSSRYESAKSYLTWGTALPDPVYGCVAVLDRTGGGGHVGFVVGHSLNGSLLILGGNQGDAVNLASFGRDRVIGYRWPAGYPMAAQQLAVGSAPSSARES